MIGFYTGINILQKLESSWKHAKIWDMTVFTIELFLKLLIDMNI